MGRTGDFVADGGGYIEAQRKALFEPARKRLGIEICGEGADNMISCKKAQIEGKNVLWDIAEVGPDGCVNGTLRGLFEPLDHNALPNAKDLPESFRQPDWIGYIAYSTVLAWSKKKYGENGPKTWADFWDVKKFPAAARCVGSPTSCLNSP